MARTTKAAAEADDTIIEGESTRVPGSDDDVVEDLEQRRRERALSPIPTRQLVLTNDDRMTMHGLITAQLGAQGLTVSPAEFEYFIRVCELRGVNPLFREAHLIKDRDGRITVQIGIDGFRKLSEDSGEYRGLTAAEWSDEVYTGPVLAWKDKPAHVRVGVIRTGFDEPVYGEAWLEEDGQTDRDGKPIGQWGKRPRTMLEKVAEVRARRKAFPRSLAGLYSDEEIPGSDDQLAAPSDAPRLVGGTPAAATTAPAPARATETAGTVPEGTWTPPEPPPAPDGLQGPIEKDVDGIRRVKPSSEAAKKHGIGQDGPVDKLEVTFKVKGRKYTAMLFGDQAIAGDAAELRAGEVVSINGIVEERIWQEGKPPVKELWGVTAVSVLRDNVWIDVLGTAPTLPLDDEPPAVAAAVPTSTAAATSSSSAASPPSSASDEPPDTTPPGRRPLADAPAIPLPRDDDAVAGPFLVRIIEQRWREASGRRFGSMRVQHGSGELLNAVVGDEPAGELEATLGSEAAPVYTVGQDVRILGFWRNGWIVISAIGIDPL